MTLIRERDHSSQFLIVLTLLTPKTHDTWQQEVLSVKLRSAHWIHSAQLFSAVWLIDGKSESKTHVCRKEMKVGLQKIFKKKSSVVYIAAFSLLDLWGRHLQASSGGGVGPWWGASFCSYSRAQGLPVTSQRRPSQTNRYSVFMIRWRKAVYVL